MCWSDYSEDIPDTSETKRSISEQHVLKKRLWTLHGAWKIVLHSQPMRIGLDSELMGLV